MLPVPVAEAGLATAAATYRRPPRDQLIEHLQVIEVAKAVHGDEAARVGLLQHVGQLVPTVQEIHRHGGGPDAGYGELERHEFGVVGHQQRDVVAGPHAGGRQSGSEAAGPFMQFPIAPGTVVGDHELALRPACGGVGEGLVQRARLPSRVLRLKGLLAFADGHTHRTTPTP